METLEDYLKKEFKAQKEKLDSEFVKKKDQLKKLWEEKIKHSQQNLQERLAKAKLNFINYTYEKTEQDFLRLLNEKKANLQESFLKEAFELLKKIDKETQDKLNFALISSLKKKFNNDLKGEFSASKSVVPLLQKHFPNAKIKIRDDLALGFLYTDDFIEIDATEQSIIKRYFEKYVC